MGVRSPRNRARKPDRRFRTSFGELQKRAGSAPEPVEEEEEVSSMLAALPAEVIKRVDALEKLQVRAPRTVLSSLRLTCPPRAQEETDELEKQHTLALREVELRFAKLFDATYEKRRDIVTGATEAEGVAPGAATRGIPKFWLTAMLNHREISSFVEEADLPALEALEDITMTYLPKMEVRARARGTPESRAAAQRASPPARSPRHAHTPQGFILHFHFRANAFFENAVLSKEYQLPGELLGSAEEDEEEGEEEEDEQSPLEGVKKIVGTDITWKAGKNLCMKMVTKKVKGGRGKPKKSVTRQEEVPSFFRFFETPDMDLNPEMEAEEVSALPHTPLFPCARPG
jgi:nucleosome assembly protein 1-like 1